MPACVEKCKDEKKYAQADSQGFQGLEFLFFFQPVEFNQGSCYDEQKEDKKTDPAEPQGSGHDQYKYNSG